MSRPLDKLAPETRAMIYKYVLSFDTPLKHITKMQPFVKKLTGSEVESGPPHITGSDTEAITELQRVNTSILTASKPVYVEAVAVFYKLNTIHFDAQMCTFESLVSPRATDLSLVTQVVVKIDDSVGPEIGVRLGSAMAMSTATIPAIVPNLRTCSAYISVDTEPYPSMILAILGSSLRHVDSFSKVYFNGVGSVHVVLKDSPCVELVLQSRCTIDRWASPGPIPTGGLTLTNVSATSLYQASRGDPQNVYMQHAKYVFNIFKYLLGPLGTEKLDLDGYDFWTCVDAGLCMSQHLER